MYYLTRMATTGLLSVLFCLNCPQVKVRHHGGLSTIVAIVALPTTLYSSQIIIHNSL